MVLCSVSPSTSGNVAAQDETMPLSAVEMSSALAAEETEELPSPLVNISAIGCDHGYLPTCFGGLVDNALMYQSYHMLTLKNKGGQMIPSEGTVKVVRSALPFIHQSSSGQAIRVSLISQFVLVAVVLFFC